MAIKTKNEIMESIKARLGEDNSDEAIAIIEDISDTLDDMENKSNGNEDWKAKYEENDASWRQRYRDRFFNKNEDEPDDNPSEPDVKPLTYENLFKEN